MLPVQSCHWLYFSRPVVDRRCATPLPPTGFSPHPWLIAQVLPAQPETCVLRCPDDRGSARLCDLHAWLK
ncbi:DNA-binding transcriptional regulator [Pseudomonas syringae pv. actinidiae]|uniref:DNA-binding transcriptional regulator n=1 Tax=Pseudomonas syringae pv. actinidiae TaxID=103796 RepID=A0A2V0QB64_PSESF|nr:DNA-binding transcriptional regulator [Pseudomonas syringae pv. actinidiae]